MSKESTKSIKDPELNSADKSTFLPKCEYNSEAKKDAVQEKVEDKPKMPEVGFEDNSKGKLVSVKEGNLKSPVADLSQTKLISPTIVKNIEEKTNQIPSEKDEIAEKNETKLISNVDRKADYQVDSEESADDSMSLIIDLDNKPATIKEKVSVFDFDERMEESLRCH